MTEHGERVAIITVHGVADQQPGQTVNELARLLCHGDSESARYAGGEKHQIIVPVSSLNPALRNTRPAVVTEPDPLLRVRPGRPSNFFLSLRTTAGPSAGPATKDLGVALTDHLIARYRPSERDALYESTRISLRRTCDGTPVDLYELYWADYSRLRPGGFRALSALYQLIFHLGTLARDVVDHVALATGGGGAMHGLQVLHAWSAWLQQGPIALVQLMMLLLVAFGATALVTEDQQSLLLGLGGAMAAVALAALGVVAALRTSGVASCLRRIAPWAVGALGLATISGWSLFVPEYVAQLYFFTAAALTLTLGALLLRRYSRTVSGVRLVGAIMLAALGALLLFNAGQVRGEISSLYEWMLTTALNSGEYFLAALLVSWACLVLVQIAAVVMGFALARRGGGAVGASLATARAGMVISTSLFAILSLLLWAVIAYVAGLTLEDFLFMPVVFKGLYTSPANFFDRQVTDVGMLFTPLLALAGVIGGSVLFALAPSLREELAPGGDEQSSSWAARLGKWWTRGRQFIGVMFSGFVPLLSIFGGMAYLLFVGQKMLGFEGALGWLGDMHGEVLVMIGQWLAGGAVTMTALGARFTQTFGKLRVALDAALDVDNYFQDPLDGLPPRARIFSRYAALLAEIRRRGYARVVMVAHSQGTVISADLLRYLAFTGRGSELAGTARLSLVTLGSPLRDLYATLFPFLYRWMGASPRSFASAAPAVSEVAVDEWTNAYRAGDYVGRSLWTAPSEASMFRVATVSSGGEVSASRGASRTEICLGAGAHTHYFDQDARALVAEIDRLVSGRPAGDPGFPERTDQ